MPGDVYNELASQFRTELREQLRIVRSFMEDATRRDAPVLSGDLRRSIVMEDFHEGFDWFTATISANAPQAAYTEYGTGEYIGAGRIYPTHAKALSFYWFRVGKHMVLASVAGQPGQHWFEGPDGQAMEQRFDDACDAAFGR